MSYWDTRTLKVRLGLCERFFHYHTEFIQVTHNLVPSLKSLVRVRVQDLVQVYPRALSFRHATLPHFRGIPPLKKMISAKNKK